MAWACAFVQGQRESLKSPKDGVGQISLHACSVRVGRKSRSMQGHQEGLRVEPWRGQG